MVTKKLRTSQNLIADIVERLKSACGQQHGITPEAVAEVEKGVRADWGGDRVFIARGHGSDHSQRNSRIMRDYLRGERLALLSRRYEISERQVLRVIKAPSTEPEKSK